MIGGTGSKLVEDASWILRGRAALCLTQEVNSSWPFDLLRSLAHPEIGVCAELTSNLQRATTARVIQDVLKTRGRIMLHPEY